MAHYPKLLRACAFALILPVIGCAGGLGGDDYKRGEVGRVQRIEEGVIERVRSVRIEGTKTIVGPAAGAVIGGVAGSTVGGGDEERTIMAIAGAVLGGLAGGAIEEGVTRQTGFAYTIRKSDRQLVTLVQADNVALAPGQRVTIEYGDRVRVAPR
ncbi:MAG: glycine zipper 2TM domain-containing protein [Caulobacterales bacterium]|jgi:outer membrane lipoprotein SlyB